MTIPPVLIVFLIVVALISLFSVMWIRRESQIGGGFQTWLNALNTVALRTLIAIGLSVIVVLTNLITNVLSIAVNIEQVEATYWFVFGLLGVDAGAWIAKRATHKTTNEPPPVGEQRTVTTTERVEPIIPHNPNPAAQPPVGAPNLPPVWG